MKKLLIIDAFSSGLLDPVTIQFAYFHSKPTKN